MPFIKGYCENSNDVKALWEKIKPTYNEIKCKKLVEAGGAKLNYFTSQSLKGEWWIFFNPLRAIIIQPSSSEATTYFFYSGLCRRVYADSSSCDDNAYVSENTFLYSGANGYAQAFLTDTNNAIWVKSKSPNKNSHFVWDGIYQAFYLPKSIKHGDIIEIENRKCIVFRGADARAGCATAISID